LICRVCGRVRGAVGVGRVTSVSFVGVAVGKEWPSKSTKVKVDRRFCTSVLPHRP